MNHQILYIYPFFSLFIHRISRHNGPDWNNWLLILFGVSIWIMVPIIAQNGLELEEIFYQSTVTVNEWIFGWPLHIRSILDIFIWNGSRVLNISVLDLMLFDK